MAVTNKSLVFASEVPRLEELIRGTGGEPLASTPAYKRVAAEYPAKASMVAFQDQQDQLKTIYEGLRSGQAGEQLQGMNFDFSKLPPFEDIKQYLMSGGSYAVPDKNGALFVSFSLKAE